MSEEIDKSIEETNNKLKEITSKISDLNNQIVDLKKESVGISENLLDGLSKNIDKWKELCEIAKTFTRENSSNELYRSLNRLYNISFHGIVSGRVATTVTFPDVLKRYGWSNELWINSRGLAFKPNEHYYRWRNHDTNATICIDFDVAVNMIKQHPEIENFIPKEEKKEIFKAFHNCLSSWKFPDKDINATLTIKGLNIIILETSSGYSSGVNAVTKKDCDILSIRPYGEGFYIEISKKDTWNNHLSFTLGDTLETKQKFAVSQFSDDVIKQIKVFLQGFKDSQEHNRKL
jgi:hypothetical protein